MVDLDTAIATLYGVGTQYDVVFTDGDRYRVYVSSGPGSVLVGDFPTYREAVEYALEQAEQELEEV